MIIQGGTVRGTSAHIQVGICGLIGGHPAFMGIRKFGGEFLFHGLLLLRVQWSVSVLVIGEHVIRELGT
jgi:hypothetical protein